MTPLIHKFIDDALRRREENVHNIQDKRYAGQYSALLDYMVTQTEDRKVMRDMISNLLLAGESLNIEIKTKAH